MLFENIIIIGSGPAGLTAGIYATRSMLAPLIMAGPCPGGQLVLTSEVENFPGFVNGIQGPELMDQMSKQAIRLGARIISESIEAVDLQGPPFHLLSSSGNVYVTNCLIIATGCESKMLNLKDEDKLIGKGISTCATCDGYFYKDKTVVVIGGADTAATDSLYLSKIAKQVTVICRGKQLSCNNILKDRISKQCNINVLYNSTVVEYISQQSKLEAVKVVSNDLQQLIKTNGAFIAIGAIPRTSIFNELKKTESGYIITESNSFKTNISGVFVAGDIIDGCYKQAIIASCSGCIAALEAERFLCQPL